MPGVEFGRVSWILALPQRFIYTTEEKIQPKPARDGESENPERLNEAVKLTYGDSAQGRVTQGTSGVVSMHVLLPFFLDADEGVRIYANGWTWIWGGRCC